MADRAWFKSKIPRIDASAIRIETNLILPDFIDSPNEHVFSDYLERLMPSGGDVYDPQLVRAQDRDAVGEQPLYSVLFVGCP